MSFFDESLDQKARLAMNRTQRHLQSVGRHALENPLPAAVAVGSLAVLLVFMPGPVLLALAITALALICFNLLTSPSILENVKSTFGM